MTIIRCFYAHDYDYDMLFIADEEDGSEDV